MKKILNLLTIFLFSFLLQSSNVWAADYYVNIIRDYYVEGPEIVRVVETHTLSNKSSDKIISENNTEKFFIHVTTGTKDKLEKTVSTIKATVDGSPINYTVNYVNDFAEINVKLPRAIKTGQNLTIKLEYSNYALVEANGTVIDFYAPGYSDEMQNQEVGSTAYTIDTYVNVAQNMPTVNFANPKAVDKAIVEGYIKYYYSYDSLVKKYIWIQIGTVQNYKFSIKQEIKRSEENDSGLKNEYRLIVPRNMYEPHIYQNVFFTNISHQPYYVEIDSLGNLIFVFQFPSNVSDLISIEGYAEVGVETQEVSSATSGQINEIINNQFTNELNSVQYWEANDPQIVATAKQIINGEENIYLISERLYNYIINKIDYSKVKRFGLNERQGALNTLNGSAAVCMEYSDLFIALSRSIGVPARAVFGYGYDPKLIDSRQDAHQWVQVYMPGIDNWVSVDVTWGEAGIGMAERNLNHFYTHVASVGPNTPPLVEWKGYGQLVGLEPPKYEIEVTATIPDINNMETQEELLEKYPYKSEVVAGIDSIGSFLTQLKNQISMSTVLIIIGITLMLVAIYGVTRIIKSEA